MLGQRRRRWASSKATLAQRLVFARILDFAESSGDNTTLRQCWINVSLSGGQFLRSSGFIILVHAPSSVCCCSEFRVTNVNSTSTFPQI